MPATIGHGLSPQAASELAEIIEDPALFVRHILGHDPWRTPEQIMDAISKPRARVAVKACHSSSKTYTAAELVLWFVTAFPDGIVVSTAPTQTQVRELLWMEIRKAIDTARIALPEPNLTELRIEDGRYALGRATNQGVRFQGFHGRVLIVIDEAPGVDAEIWDAIDGIRAGGDVRVLALGNPVIASGRFYEIFNDELPGWDRFTIGAFDTPNCEGLTLDEIMAMEPGSEELAYSPRPYLTTRDWVRDRHNSLGGRYCPRHILDYTQDGNGRLVEIIAKETCIAEEVAEFQSRVLGQFPQQSEDALISQAWLEAARRRPPCPDHEREGYVAGVDVAGKGSAETVVYIRQGPNIVGMWAFPGADPRGDVINVLRPYLDDISIYVDEIGVGYGFMLDIRDKLYAEHEERCERLIAAGRGDELPPGPAVVGVNVGEAAIDKDRFANLKAELYWQVRDQLQAGEVCGLTDDRTRSQLAGIRTMPNARGQNTIESKEAAAKRGVASPDRAEAYTLCLTGAPRPRALIFGSILSQSNWR